MSIKVLIAFNRDSYMNPYVSTLADGLIGEGCNVTCSIDEFWQNAIAYDVVHVQWPNLFADKMGEHGEILENVLKELKEKHIPIVVTLHNLVPHSSQNTKQQMAYKIVFNYADCFIHMGTASIDLLKEKWPNIKAEHFVVFHHTYDALYDMNRDKLESRKILGIPRNVKCILCFGKFRNDEERNLIINLRKKLDSSYYFLLPGFYYESLSFPWKNVLHGIRSLLFRIRENIKYTIIAKKYRLHISHKYISDEDLPVYLSAADVLIVQRLKILNSGNVSLAMHAGLPVVGPNVGNVGWMLKKTGNPCFDVNNLDAFPNVVKSALSQEKLGELNKTFAKDCLSTKTISQQTKNIYEKMIMKFQQKNKKGLLNGEG